MADVINVGVIGCGNISGQYFKGLRPYGWLRVVAVSDLLIERAKEAAGKFEVPRACSVEELLADDEIDLVVNLTIPGAHADVNQAILAAGKHAYVEKPLAVTRDSGRATLAAAEKAGRRVGCAPDTFLGGGIQTARRAIDEGLIGRPVSATAFFTCPGHERWHPSPAFYYQPGGGPMLDMGPYYLTALVNLLGPIERVSGMTGKAREQRTITAEAAGKLCGTNIPVQVPTHVAGLMRFAGGAIGTIITSFDVWGANLPRIEVHGTEGSLSVPDPNRFDGEVRLLAAGEKEWRTVEHRHRTDVGRGIGAADMAAGILSGRPHRASGRLALHVLDAMQAFGEASDAGGERAVKSACEQPAALPARLAEGELD